MPQNLGLSLLYEPPTGRTVAADIVFVHGMGGGSIGTWSSGNTCWPRDILKENIPQARIFSHGYDSKVYKSTESGSRTSIVGQADSLLHDLVRSRRTVKHTRPILFVCHSLGGLVVKQALVRSSEHHHSQQTHHVALGHIVSATTAVIFMGTPHRGSSKATLGKIVAKAGRVLGANDRILKSLENGSAFLEQQRNSFDSIRQNFLTVCLWEELPISFVGHIVPEASACIDGPDILKEHLPGCDHKSMAKFNSRTDKGYTIVLDYLQQALETAFSPEDSDTGAEDSEEQTAAIAAEITSQCILNSLEFDEIDHRFTSITDAHKSISKFGKSTYDWIFEDGKINGKAGSGKSTLMKFIANQLPSRIRSLRSDPSTDLLPLESASFFFWAAGTTKQKSHQGLFRTILYNLLSNHHHFVQEVFSKKWSYIYRMALEMCHQEINSARRKRPQPNPDTWHKRVLVNLKAQATHQGTLGWGSTNFLTPLKYVLSHLTSTRVLLLIDGLDEYDGSEDELDGLVALLQTWAQLPNIKICVSTRPWTVFEANFGRGQVPSLRLQDLTSDDIELYVEDSFNHSSLMSISRQANPHLVTDLHSSIVKKAEGVFLWVYLVVKSLINGLRNGDELSVLLERLDELPSDLDSLYRHMLQRVPKRYWSASFRLFSVMRASIKPPRALLLWYLGERGYDPLEDNLSKETKLARCYQLYLRLMTQCAGLLELRADFVDRHLDSTESSLDMAIDDDTDVMRFGRKRSFKEVYSIDSTVHYLHRTAHDFLAQADIEGLWKIPVLESRFDSTSWLATRMFIDMYEVAMRVKEIEGEYIPSFLLYEWSEGLRTFIITLESSPNRGVRSMLDKMINGVERGVFDPQGPHGPDEYTSLLGDVIDVRESWPERFLRFDCLSRFKPARYPKVGEDLMDRDKTSQDIYAVLKWIDSI
ncbi:hypothetical protein NM208_g2021 [Fusarium decemcellulare]|uniref:Uncharacterized protein n=1 Tax=Fusarium decemcellulare TaxID=57161 RepID=A0ACC1SU39_9HYPO|nr:hypothetical protein NM208_g2021 [Fusarium decemcellulare]